LTLIVAATLSNGIGQSSRLPWRLPAEMAYFARVTSSAPEGSINAVIMGRNTWESIPKKFRPLPRRLNVIISRNADYYKTIDIQKDDASPTVVRSSLEDAIAHVVFISKQDSHVTKVHRCFVIGGGTIYKEALDLSPLSQASAPATVTAAIADRVLLTRILEPAFPDCDVFLPEIRNVDGGNAGWMQASHEELEEWVGGEVPRGNQEEKGVQYEFQMWTR